MAKPVKNKRNKTLDSKSKNQTSPQSSSISSILKPKTNPDNQPKGFKFISNTYSAHLECPICQQLMIRPMRIHPCGHTFCQKCIDPYMSLEKKLCPFNNCLRKFQITQNDRTVQNLIDELKVQCTNEPCVYKGVFNHYKQHHKDTCAFKNGGIDTWLGNLTQGLVLTQKASQLNDQLDSNSYSKPIGRLENFQDSIEESIHQDSQILENGEHLQRQNNEEKIQIKSYRKSRQNRNEQNHHDQEQKKEKEQEKSISNPHSINNSVSSESGRDLNFSIFNIPFGPSIRQQINSSDNTRNEFLQKQLKKLQG